MAQVNRAMAQVDQVTQRNASAAEELASTAEELAAQAEALEEMVSFFRVATERTTPHVSVAAVPPRAKVLRVPPVQQRANGALTLADGGYRSF